MNTKFKTAAEAAAHLAKKPEVAEAVERDIQLSSLVSLLVEKRMDKGMTQEEVAISMKCDASKISRMESCSDAQLRLSDIVRYSNALGVQISVMFDDTSLPASARIKQCVMQIDRDLKKLVHIAQKHDGNAEIATKISQFYQEVLFNFLVKYVENKEKLRNFVPLNQTDAAGQLETAAESECEGEGEIEDQPSEKDATA